MNMIFKSIILMMLLMSTSCTLIKPESSYKLGEFYFNYEWKRRRIPMIRTVFDDGKYTYMKIDNDENLLEQLVFQVGDEKLSQIKQNDLILVKGVYKQINIIKGEYSNEVHRK